MNAAVRDRALELGFDDCRITTAAPPASAPHFQQWLAEQQHGEMTYLARNAQKRVNPDQVLPGAKSIITLAASYGQGKEEVRMMNDEVEGVSEAGSSETAPPQALAPSTPSDELHHSSFLLHNSGLVARYARYRDYHDVLADRLKQLTEFITQLGGPGTRSLWYADTGPLLERDLAQRAGLGFIGKHTNLISRHLGNWFLLSEVITTLELEADAPERNQCGSCTRCLTACPTGAITAPFRVDARRCISYLTIELKGPIPVELRPAIGNRIFGCDDCLAACPWNRFARAGRLMQAHARPDLAQADLVEWLSLDEAGFKQRFAGTPLFRSKRRGLLRNVCVALGNTGDASALPALERATREPEPLIAEHARWAIDQIEQRQRPR